jgi:uncharacterized protein YggE
MACDPGSEGPFSEHAPMLKLTAFAFAAAMLVAAPALAEDKTVIPTLTSSAEGSVEVTPDIVNVTLGVVSNGKTAAEALAANSKDMNAAIEAIRGAGIAEKDIATSGFNINPIYAPRPDNRPDEPAKVIGYEVSNQVTVIIRDLKASGAILDKVVAAGANQVTGISFDVADPAAPADAALKDAIAKARKKAELMAAAAGLKLVRIVSVTTDGAARPVFAAYDGMVRAAKAPTPIMAGSRTVSATATIIWEVAAE